MKLLLAASTVAVLGFASPARAQPGTVQPVPASEPSRTYPTAAPVSEQTAFGLSFGGTVVSWGLLIAGSSMESEGLATVGAIGTMFAPSFGHWYARKPLTRGFGLRAIGVGLATIAFSLVIDDIFSEDTDDEGTASMLLLLGAGAYVVGTVDDIATASSSARAYNTRIENLTVVPTLNAHGGGLAIGGRF